MAVKHSTGRRKVFSMGSAVCTKTVVGLDLGDKYSQVLVVSPRGEVLEERRIRTTPPAFEDFFSKLKGARVAMEAGSHSPWVSRQLKKSGQEVLVANPRKLALITENNQKCDRVDAESLAYLASRATQLLHPIEHRGPEAQADLALLRARDALVKSRTLLINSARGMVKSMGGRIEASAHTFHNLAMEDVPKELRPAITRIVRSIGELAKDIRNCDKQIEKACEEKYPETNRLRQVKGVGALTSLAYILTVENPHRFRKSRSVGAYFGLTPRTRQSGASSPELSITKAGDVLVRRLLVGSAHYILGPHGEECDLRHHGLSIAERGGKTAKKRAIVAVARKLSILLHRLWVTGEVYEPLRNTQRRAKGSPPRGASPSSS